MQDNFNIHSWRINQTIKEMEEKFPDLSGDGKITQKDILIAKGVIKKESELSKDYINGYNDGYMDGVNKKQRQDFEIEQDDEYASDYSRRRAKELYEDEDHEVSMAQASLKSIVNSATQLMNKLGNNERNIPGWIQDHIINAENYIDQANQGFHELDNEYEED